jgi:transcriptional regulator with XRE-family HTH domain
MRRSPLRHPLAILRTTIGLTQKEMANLVDRTPSTIQSVELGKLPLSEDLAMLIAEATGADAGWLLEGNPDTPPRKGITAMGMGAGTGSYTRADYEFHRAFLESPVATTEELKAAHQAASQSSKAGKKLVHLALPVFKRAVLAKKKEALQALDKVMLRNLQSILDQTATSEAGDLIRWKIRQLFQALAEEHHLSALAQAMAPDPFDQEVVVAELAATHSPEHSAQKGSRSGKPRPKAQLSFDVAEEPSTEDRLLELSAGKPGGTPTVLLHPRIPRAKKKSKTT